jgi:ABC-type Mn2+/Zn2+ transport system ATPase subunit
MSAVIAESLAKLAEVEKPANPFPGLRPFEFHESHLFFGRDGQSEQLIAKLAATRFLAVVGTSGSGKSSLVRAGLLPALFGCMMTNAGSHWRVAVMRGLWELPWDTPISCVVSVRRLHSRSGLTRCAGRDCPDF